MTRSLRALTALPAIALLVCASLVGCASEEEKPVEKAEAPETAQQLQAE